MLILKLIALLVMLLIGNLFVPFQGGPSIGPKIDMSYHRSYPAGPYAQVQTANGTLTTSVPLVSLDGPGDTGLSFSLVHRSNIGIGQFALTIGRPGRGWSHNYDMTCGTSTNTASQVVCYVGGNEWGEWYRQNPQQGGSNAMLRHPGTRGDLERLKNANDQTTGFIVTNQADKSKWHFTKQSGTVAGYLYAIEKIVDRFGNQVDFYYTTAVGNTPRLLKVEDASNQRWLEILYGNDNSQSGTDYNTISEVRLVVNNQIVRTWILTTGSAGADAYLGNIIFPHPDTNVTSLATSPKLSFNYYSLNSNIADAYDLKGNRHHYEYITAPNMGTTAVSKVWRPHPTVAGGLDSHAVEFTFTVAGQPGTTNYTRTCHIFEPYGDAANPSIREFQHTYDIGLSQTNYFVTPILKVQDPIDGGLNYWETFEWDYSQAMLKKYWDREGNMWEYGNDGNLRGLIYWSKDPNLKLSEFFYINDQLVEEVLPIDTSATKFRVNKYSYDNTTFSLLTSTGDATSSVYRPISNPTGLAVLTTNTYTPQGELETTKIGTDNPTTHSNFDDFGNAWRTTLPGGGVVKREFSALNYLETEYLPDFPSTGADVRVTIYSKDYWGRNKEITYPGPVLMKEKFTYDWNGNVLISEDENGYPTTTAYDNLNRVLTVRRPVDTVAANDLVTTNTYYYEGTLREAISPKGDATLHEYSSRGNLLRIRYPDLTGNNWSEQYTYDGNGNVLTSKDGNNKVTTSTYDSLDRLISVAYPTPNLTGAVRSKTFTYYDNGTRKSLTYNINGTNYVDTYGVNTAGLVTTQFQDYTDKTTATSYYGGSGRKQTLAIKTGTTTNMTWTYTYDSNGKMQRIAQSQGSPVLADFSYFPDESLDRMYHGDAQIAAFWKSHNYDSRGRLLGTGYVGLRDYIFFCSYVYDKVGNITQYELDKFGYQTLWRTNYGYDRAYRLTSESRENPYESSTYDYDFQYKYDKNGNRTEVIRDGVVSQYQLFGGTTQNNDRFGSGESYAATGYNNNGSPTQLNTPNGYSLTFAYDYDEKPLAITKSVGTSSTFTYDGDGRRVQSVTSVGTRRLVYDGDTVIAETDGSGNFTQYFVQGIGYVKMNGSTPQQHYYYTNGHGSTIADVMVTNGYEQVFMEYDGYGVQRDVPIQNDYPGTANQYRFAGKHGYQTEVDTGMQLLGARFYIPAIGRFLTRDPIGHAGGLNLYAYCNNNPVNCVDPDGTEGYWTEVGRVLQGYGDALNPVNMWHSGVAMANNVIKDPLHGPTINLVHATLGLWRTGSAAVDGDSRAFGQIFMTGLLTSAPAIKKIPISATNAGKIEALTAAADLKYPKLAGKSQGHHNWPKYLGGPANGPVSKIPASYHQLITNEFRRLAPYGKSGGVNPSQARKIMNQVYSKYPLPKK